MDQRIRFETDLGLVQSSSNKVHNLHTEDDRRTAPSAPHAAEAAAGKQAYCASLVLIDRRYLTRECLSNWFAASGSSFEIHAHETVADAVAARGERPDGGSVVLYSVGAGTAFDADVADDLAELVEAMPGVPITLISDSEDPAAIVEALQQGVRGYIPTSISASVLVGAIHLIRSGGTYVPATAVTLIERQGGRRQASRTSRVLEHFTPRQVQVLDCLRQGKPNKNIAYELNMCESTVKVHVRHIMKKLNATNRTQVAFLTNDLFGPSEAPQKGN